LSEAVTCGCSLGLFVTGGTDALGIATRRCFIASPVRRAPTFFLDKKSRQKNQDAFKLAERSNKKSSVGHLA
jgi:hypothetical protein